MEFDFCSLYCSEHIALVFCFVDFPVSVDHTSLPKHLNRMLELLSEENQLATENQTGPCVEYMLEHRVLEALCSLGQADVSITISLE